MVNVCAHISFINETSRRDFFYLKQKYLENVCDDKIFIDTKRERFFEAFYLVLNRRIVKSYNYGRVPNALSLVTRIVTSSLSHDRG